MATPSKVTRITAKDDAVKEPKKASAKAAPVKNAKADKVSKVAKAQKPEKAKRVKKAGKTNVFGRIGEYLKGAWYELRQVRWPNRQSTWSLTLAVILFSLFIMGLIVLLDMLFSKLFEIIIA